MTTDIIPQAALTKRDKGFTLVELLIVIAILGVLATITVLSVRGISNNSVSSACRADTKTYQVAIEAYAAQNNGTLPTEAQLLSTGLIKSSSNRIDVATAAGGTAPNTYVIGDIIPQTGGSETCAWADVKI
jgi:prepilin-type N-terminal cleavage/methylation domain-containing protein